MNSKPVVAVCTWNFGFAPVECAGRLAAAGAPALEAIEAGIKIAEDDPNVTSVGYGGYPNSEGVVELDAAIFDGPRHLIGAVSGLRGIRHPISVARLVLETTPHAILTGQGALQFALQNGFNEEDLLSPRARDAWRAWKLNPTSHRGEGKPWFLGHDTICLLLRDSKEDLYGGTSTSGLAWKMPGRVGDTPLIGSGLFVDNNVGAAAATGVGELAISQCASFAVVELMRQSYDPTEACELVLQRVLRATKFPEPRQLALIALRKDGKFGFSCLKSGFQAAVYFEETADLIEVPPLAFQ